MEKIGSKPPPRILVLGTEPDGELGRFIDEIAPTVRFVQSEGELSYLRQAEWDAAVVCGASATRPNLQRHLMVIQFGGSAITNYLTSEPRTLIQVFPAHQSVATEFLVPENLPVGVRKLVSSSLLPWLQEQAVNSFIAQRSTGASKPLDIIEPFVMDADRSPLAGIIRLGAGEWWWLPSETPDKDLWIATALSEWSKIDPTNFPSEPIWVKRPQWQTREERDAFASLHALQEERSQFLADIGQRENELIRQCEESRMRADRHERRLVTAQGGELVEEVYAALEELGFLVQDVDLEQAPKGIKLEDLRIKDPTVTDWIALAEVRGYSSGAKSSDFQRIGRFVEHYIRMTGYGPSARWYIVNHNLNADPSARPPVLAGAADDVAIFKDADGLVIDTRVLFAIREQVRMGTLATQDARRFMRAATGILGLP